MTTRTRGCTRGRTRTIGLLGALALTALAGCGVGPEVPYGRSRGSSLNGTGALAALLRERGHEVRIAIRLTPTLEDWADVIVRFAQRPGPPARDEAEWYDHWLDQERGRQMIYVPRDYDAQADYWNAVLEQLPADPKNTERKRASTLRDEARDWPSHLPRPAKEAARPEDWFAVVEPKLKAAFTCKTLSGPWARGIDAASAALPRHATLKLESETLLLAGDGLPVAMTWTRFNASRVLVIANAGFLLNAALANPARRPLALQMVDWLGERPRRIALVEGAYVIGEEPSMRSVFELLGVAPFGWIAAQMFALGLAACLARAPRLGRARPEPLSGADRPAAHAEALGTLLARSHQPEKARAALEAYSQWRRRSAEGPTETS